MTLPDHKTKIVATIGPASESPRDARAADPRGHERRPPELLARRLRGARATNRATSGPPSARRAGAWRSWPICRGRRCASARSHPSRSSCGRATAFTLTAHEEPGTAERVSVSFERLPAGREARRQAVPERRPRAAVRRPRRGRATCAAAWSVGGELRSQEGPEPARHRSRRLGVHRARPRMPGVRPGARRRRRQPVVRGDGGRHHARCARRPASWGTARSSSRRSSEPARWTTTTRSSRPPTASWWRAATSASRSRSRASR